MTLHSSFLAPRSRGCSQTILLDCDSVLLNWYEGFRLYLKSIGIIAPMEYPNTWDLSPWTGLDGKQSFSLIERFNAGECGGFSNLPAVDYAKEGITELKNAGRNLHIITSCSKDPAVKDMRVANLIDVFGDVFEDIHCLDLSESKKPYLEAYRNATWVEDKYENAEMGALAGHKSYLIRWPYNASYAANSNKDIIWVDGWRDIVRHELAA